MYWEGAHYGNCSGRAVEVIIEKCISRILPAQIPVPSKAATPLQEERHLIHEQTVTRAKVPRAITSTDSSYNGCQYPSPLLAATAL